MGGIGSLSVIVVSGILSFLGLFLSFDYWYEKIWLGGMYNVSQRIVQLGEELFVRKPIERVMTEQCMLSGGIAFFFFFFFWPNLMIALPVCTIIFYYAWRLPLLWLTHRVRPVRIAKFSVQMVDALTLMANGLKSGLNVPQTLQIVVDEMPNPIREEFGLILTENKLGVTFEKAFDGLAKRIPSEDVNMFVTSVNILRETGGNIAETFDTICQVIRERMKLQSKISAMVAQGMMSALIVGSMPWFLALMLYTIDPVTTKPLFTHPIGWLILLGVCVLEGMGIFIIMKIVRIKV